MFVMIRIINGIIAIIALFGFYLFASMQGQELKMLAIPFGIVVVIYLVDLLLRKKEERSDVLFAILWTLIHAGSLTLATRRYTEGDFDSWLLWTAGLCLGPFLANLTYLLTVFKKKVSV